MDNHNIWMASTSEVISGYRKMIDAALIQLDDEQFFAQPGKNDGQFNSVANVLRHLGGNLKSRFTNFLTEDGEKPDRNRDQEFADWEGDRRQLIEYFDEGWRCLVDTLNDLTPENFDQQVQIRGEPHSVPLAIQRAITHIAYHVGQLVLVSRMMHGDQGWNWMTIEPRQSAEFNESTWGTSASRGIAGSDQ